MTNRWITGKLESPRRVTLQAPIGIPNAKPASIAAGTARSRPHDRTLGNSAIAAATLIVAMPVRNRIHRACADTMSTGSSGVAVIAS